MSLKKYSMLAIKAGVGLVPKPVRNFAKKNPALTSLYSRSLQKSGLFYGFPSKKKLQALYNQSLAKQASDMNQILADLPVLHAKISVAIIGNDALGVSKTLASLVHQSAHIESVLVQCTLFKQQTNTKTLNITAFNHLTDDVVTSENVPLLLLECGDELHPSTLALLARQHITALLYVDTDEKNAGNTFENARMLPDWNPDYQLTYGYIETGVVLPADWRKTISTITAKSIAGLIGEWWLKSPGMVVEHFPYALIHRPDSNAKKRAQLKEITQLVNTIDARSRVVSDKLVNVIQWPIFNTPLVSLIIPTKNAKELVKECIESILTKSTYQNFEILLVDNNSDEPESLAYFEELNQHEKIRVLKYPHPFNYSAINNFAAQQAKGEVIGLINNDIEVITPDWLEYMVGHALREDIGCVGAKLMYGDDRIQHAGVVLGYGGGAGHAHKYFPRYHPGYMNRLIASHNYSAVTAACLLVKKSLFEAVGGLNETDLTVAFNDVDFCLRVRAQGVRNLYCAEAELYHHESVSRGLDVSKEKMARFNAELDYLKSNWSEIIEHDPAYNPNLTLRRENFSIKEKSEQESSIQSSRA